VHPFTGRWRKPDRRGLTQHHLPRASARRCSGAFSLQNAHIAGLGPASACSGETPVSRDLAASENLSVFLYGQSEANEAGMFNDFKLGIKSASHPKTDSSIWQLRHLAQMVSCPG
jgi:hypothetical protein